MLSFTGQGHLEVSLWFAVLSSTHREKNESSFPFNRLIVFITKKLYFDHLMLNCVIILPVILGFNLKG